MIGAGAALSNLVAGWVVDMTGYEGGFIFLAGVALVALGLFYAGVPGTGPAVSTKPRAATVKSMRT